MSKRNVLKDEEGMELHEVEQQSERGLLTLTGDDETLQAIQGEPRSISLDKILDTIGRASVGTIKILGSSMDLIKMVATIAYDVSETLKAHGIGVTTETPVSVSDGDGSQTRSLTAQSISARALSMIYEENAASK